MPISDSKAPNNLLIGLGGTGGKILKEFKKRLYREHPDDNERNGMLPAIEFLYVDSTREMFDSADNSWRVLGRSVLFEECEFCNIKTEDGIDRILDHVESYPGLKHVVRNAEAVRNTLGRIGEAAEQKRRAGRIMFGSSVSRFLASVRDQYKKLTDRTGDERLHLHIFTGLAGGTGSGSIIDVICQLRKEYPKAKMNVYAMVPEPEIPANFDKGGRYYPNGYAALRELSALNASAYLPCDIRSGSEHIDLKKTDIKQFGLFLYTNTNENGKVFDSIKELPQIMADAVYFSLMLPRTPDTNAFFRHLTCENGTDFQVEYNTHSRARDPERARTKAISTLGIKRIVYPERRIEEHISYNVALAAIWQMLYNNFRGDGIGYISEPLQKTYSEFLSEEDDRARWKIDDSHLMLNERILEADRKFPTIDAFWENCVNEISYDMAKECDSNPLSYLENYLERQFSTKFRLNRGVETYYREKARDEDLKNQSKAIVEAIERSLYTGWYEGTFSVTDLRGTCGAILDYIRTKREHIGRDINELREDLHTYEEEKRTNQGEWNQRGLINTGIRFITRANPRIYADHQETMKAIYVIRTNIVAKNFEDRLLGRLLTDFENFMVQINQFTTALTESLEKVVNAIALRSRPEMENREGIHYDLTETEVEVSEDHKMVVFEKELLADRVTIDGMAKLLREGLAGGERFAHFDVIAQGIIPGVTIMELADQLLEAQVVAYHDNHDQFRRDPILHLNILKELQKVLGHDEERLRNFARGVMERCSVLLPQDANEVTRRMKNNPNPGMNEGNGSINQHCLCFCLPDCEGDTSLRDFSQRLETALRNNHNIAGADICISHNSLSKNEITIVQVRDIFPVRTISHLPKMKEAYDKMVNSPNEQQRRQAVILFHGEGDGHHLPPLEGEGEGPTADELRAYYFLAAATGLIAEGEDSNERHGWCYADKDIWGNTTMKLLAREFCDIEASDEMTSEIKEKITDGIEDFLGRNDLKESERKDVKKRIVALMHDVVTPECTSTTSPKYKKFSQAAEAAIGKIEQN